MCDACGEHTKCWKYNGEWLCERCDEDAQLRETTEKLTEAIELLRKASREISWYCGHCGHFEDENEHLCRIDSFLARGTSEPSEPDPLCPKCQGLGQGGDCLCEQEPSEPVSDPVLTGALDKIMELTAERDRLIADLRQTREREKYAKAREEHWHNFSFKATEVQEELEARIAELEAREPNWYEAEIEPVSEDRLQNMLDRCTGPDAPGVVMQDVKDLIADLRQARKTRDAWERNCEKEREWRARANTRCVELRARIAELEAERRDAIDADNDSRRKLTREGLVMLCNGQADDIATLTRERDEARADLRDEIDSWKHDSVASLRARAEKAESERDAETARADGFSRGVADLLKRVEKAEAEVVRLRDALVKGLREDADYCQCGGWLDAYEVITAALDEPEGGDDGEK